MHCRVGGLIVPMMLIAVGTLFLIAEYTRFSFLDLWPVLLIILGGILVCQAMVSRESHTGS